MMDVLLIVKLKRTISHVLKLKVNCQLVHQYAVIMKSMEKRKLMTNIVLHLAKVALTVKKILDSNAYKQKIPRSIIAQQSAKTVNEKAKNYAMTVIATPQTQTPAALTAKNKTTTSVPQNKATQKNTNVF